MASSKYSVIKKAGKEGGQKVPTFLFADGERNGGKTKLQQ